MNTEERIKKQKELIEDIGRYFDKEGFQPIAGRILGLLMVMDKELFTFEEIVEELNISKSSASNALRNLEIRGDVQYTTILGDRKRYFHLRKLDSLALINDFEIKISLFKNLCENILELKADKNSQNAKYANDLVKMISFFQSKMEVLKLEFKKDN